MSKTKPSHTPSAPHSDIGESHLVDGGIGLYLSYQAPFDWQAICSFLSARTIDGVEELCEGQYRRSIVIHGKPAVLEIEDQQHLSRLCINVLGADSADIKFLNTHLRQILDLDAEVIEIGKWLRRDPLLKPLVARRPGLRVVGHWDGFEIAIRAILGQQVSLGAGRKLAQTLVQLCASGFELCERPTPGLNKLFPDAAQIAATDLHSLPMPRARKRTLHALANAALEDADLFTSLATVEQSTARLQSIVGIGEWTAHYIAMRACHQGDAFPASDAALLRNMALLNGSKLDKKSFTEYAERWRPWRAYAVQHIWLSQQ